ncbi:MAG: surface lipoprotein assembly modifier [Novosphingobium sp.]
MMLSPAELFAFADAARDAGDFAAAETAYRALATNPDIELRTEARFRLALMLADMLHKFREAGVELRKILDEKPRAARVRIELARMHAQLGHAGSAERELRAAEAEGLPPEVQQMVRFYANALSARRPFGGSVELAIAPDSNINRATKSDTLGTVIGDFTLDDAAKARSGVGLALRAQTYGRVPLGRTVNLLARLSGNADIYRRHDFDDYFLGLQVGPEVTSGADRIALSVGPGWRWYGTDPYTASWSGNAAWQHPLGKRTQLRIDGGVVRTDNKRNDLQDSTLWSFSAGLDRAFGARFGGGLQLYGARDAARDPGYSTATGGVSTYLYREFGHTTAVLSLGYSHLEADERLALYPERRRDNRLSASLSATFRQVRIGTIAPLARVKWERNVSTIELYDYQRIAFELGLTTAF